MKVSKTGKPLCARCRRLATHRTAYGSTKNGKREVCYVYHCDRHMTTLDRALPEYQHLAEFFEALRTWYIQQVNAESRQLLADTYARGGFFCSAFLV